MTADELLAITRPEDLFPGNVDQAKVLYRQLSRQWHPDVPVTGSHKTFTHLSKLYHEAVERLTYGTWRAAGEVRLTMVDSSTQTIAVRTTDSFEFGTVLIEDAAVRWRFKAEHASRFKHTLDELKAPFPFTSNRMADEVSRYLPTGISTAQLDNGDQLLTVPKTNDLIRLKDVLTHTGGLDAKHVAWIVSSLMNLVCYFEFAKIGHGDISPNSYFISPTYHSGALLGGWCFADSLGERLTSVPQRTFNVMSHAARTHKRVESKTDQELVRLVGRECLGKNLWIAPKPMQKFLTEVATESAVEQYRRWSTVLEESFGKRRFTVMALTADDVYSARRSTTHG